MALVDQLVDRTVSIFLKIMTHLWIRQEKAIKDSLILIIYFFHFALWHNEPYVYLFKSSIFNVVQLCVVQYVIYL